MFKTDQILTLAAVLIITSSKIATGQDSTGDRVEMVRAMLTTMRDTKEALSSIPVPLSKDDLLVLGSFLDDRGSGSLAFFAQYTMERIDQNAAIPVDIKHLARSESNAQRDMISLMIRHSRDPGFPRKDARAAVLEALSIPSGPFSRPPFPYNLIMALGAFGTSEDIALIKTLFKTEATETDGKSDSQALNAFRWATARLGDAESLKAVRSKLLPPDPRETGFTNVRTWLAYEGEVNRLEYIGQPVLLSALAPSLRSAVTPPKFECFFFPPPRKEAVMRLKGLVDPKDYPSDPDSPNAWLEWLEKNHPA